MEQTITIIQFRCNESMDNVLIKIQKTTLEIRVNYACERRETALAMNVKKLKDTKTKEKNQENKRS